jgi:GntR family transcriptional regulator/MocR family aminotransferase
MPLSRRLELMEKARKDDFIIIEDDHEFETNYVNEPCPSLKSLDDDGHVIYVGSLSKSVFHGLRLGFLVAPKPFIDQARALRRLMVRHPPNNNQRTAALFLSLGHYDAFMVRMHQEMSRRWTALRDALNHYRANLITMPNQGGSVFWVKCPDSIDVETLASEAAKRGILIEPDTHYYAGSRSSRNCFRMGVTSIPGERIREGVKQLRELMWELASGEAEFLDLEDPALLRGAEVESVMSGSTWIYKTVYGDPATFRLHPDGRLSGRAGHADEEHDEGLWWVEGDLWCRQWKQWAYGEPKRYYISRQGQQLRLYNVSGRLVDSAIIHPRED